MIFTILLALSGITLSLVAIYYSVIGLTAIFAAAFWPIVIMGSTLEVSKLVAASWLKWRWEQIPFVMKSYLLISITILMLITSMGIFGFLSKAHLDQAVPTGDVAAQVALIDEKIKTERENIDAARRALKQMDEAVDQTMARSSTEQGAARSAQLRRNQQAERARLQKDIATAQTNISRFNEERAPIAKDLRKVEAEVGPIKYIAKLIYGDNPDQNLLEKAVTWVIIVIIFVFDPMAVLLILASQMNYQWWRKEREESKILPETIPVQEPKTDVVEDKKDVIEELQTKEVIEKEIPKNESSIISAATVSETQTELAQWNKMLEEVEKGVTEEKLKKEVTVDWTDQLKKWKEQNPDVDIFEMQKQFDAGIIDQLPWQVIEQIEDSKLDEESKKKFMIKENGQQIVKTKEI